jgi:hypothetical protein
MKMETIMLWLPVIAVAISVASLLLSLSNSVFNRKYEAAKKRTELITKTMEIMKALKDKRSELIKVKEICANCVGTQGKELCDKYDELIDVIETKSRYLEEATNLNNPLKIEQFLRRHIITSQGIFEFANSIDEFVLTCKNCKGINKESSNKT